MVCGRPHLPSPVSSLYKIFGPTPKWCWVLAHPNPHSQNVPLLKLHKPTPSARPLLVLSLREVSASLPSSYSACPRPVLGCEAQFQLHLDVFSGLFCKMTCSLTLTPSYITCSIFSLEGHLISLFMALWVSYWFTEGSLFIEVYLHNGFYFLPIITFNEIIWNLLFL